jgi:dolichol-phosphate mannosyltransferase
MASSDRPSGPPSGSLLCLPTYDEIDNLPRMVDVLEGVRASVPGGLDVMVIDDDSPDGTGRLADELAATRPWLTVLHRTRKEGLGRAYLEGFAIALECGYERVLEMDADFSHDPAELPRLVQATIDGADLVLGSRYVPGGGVENWGIVRRIISSGGCAYARTILGMHVRDVTGGFKCFRRETLAAIDLERVDAQGYTFQIEMTYRALRQGFVVLELPILFRDRVAGGSKMSRSIVLEAAWRVPLLRLAALRGRIVGRTTDPLLVS